MKKLKLLLPYSLMGVLWWEVLFSRNKTYHEAEEAIP